MPARNIHSVEFENFLSIKKVSVSLGSLNVLVGPNGSGKTNFLRAFSFVGDIAEHDLGSAIEAFGGFDALAFAGAGGEKRLSLKFVGLITEYASKNALDEYRIQLRIPPILRQAVEAREILPLVRDEDLKLKRVGGRGRRITISGGELRFLSSRSNKARVEKRLDVNETASGLALLRKLGEEYDAKQVEEIATLFEDLRLIDINVSAARRASQLSKGKRLSPDGSNIAAYLLRLRDEEPAAFTSIEEDVGAVLSTFDGFIFEQLGGGSEAVSIKLSEKPFEKPFPLDRASFGTMRAIVLFSMLNDPNPPRLTCVEEIDHGFHPQALDRLVERLREASERTQLLVATHSPALVNRLETAELIMFVRNQDDGATEIVRPDPGIVNRMRESSGYELGELWFSGLLED